MNVDDYKRKCSEFELGSRKRRAMIDSDEQKMSKSKDGYERDLMFDFKKHKWELNKLFFQNCDYIQKDSVEYTDFWKFVEKYQKVQKDKIIKDMCSSRREKISSNSCNKMKSICFKIKMESLQDLKLRLPPHDLEDSNKWLNDEKLLEFINIIHFYIDFIQKQYFQKLMKLRQSQRSLPIYEYKANILNAIEQNSVIILAGDTGCGKSTQVPQYLMEAGYKSIACTQPRRIACISLSKRVAYETLNQYGSKVGYQIRFEKHKTEHTNILFLTEGLLLRQVVSDSMLNKYNVIILDEIHERHLYTDFLLGVMKCLLVQRRDVKIILMSATINTNLFYNYFLGKAPIIQVPGRLYPITLKYCPIPSIEKIDKTNKINTAPYIRTLEYIDSTYPPEERGDLLVFLSGLKDITTIADTVRTYAQQTNKWVVLCLHSSLSLPEQEKVFDVPPNGIRKCILSTNIAETSVTIDGVRFVIDSGKVKEMKHDPSSKVQKLKEFPISQASAEQRKGRAGRTGPGVCFRLYSEDEYKSFSSYSSPEIQRVSLDSLILQMISMGLPNTHLFPFIEPPPSKNLTFAINSLKSHSALSNNEDLTDIGELLALLPVDISLGKMLIMASLFNQIEPILSLTAALSVQTPFTNRSFRDPGCTSLNEEYQSNHGDPLTLLCAYREWLHVKFRSDEDSHKWCRKRGFEEQRFYEMTKLRQQFSQMLRDSNLQCLSDRCIPTTSAERMKRYGSIQQLRGLRKQLNKQSERGAKKLKVSLSMGIDSDEEADVSTRVKDLDFKIRYDNRKLREIYDKSNVNSEKDLLLLKILLCCGLYPNLAIGDIHNNYKSGSEQVFHTAVKAGVLVHPNSSFAMNPETLQLRDCDIVEMPGFLRYPCSYKHQLLAFMSVLETNKAYLVNSFRLPAAPTLFLFARSIDTNVNLSVIVFDQFIEIKFVECTAAQDMLFKIVYLRKLWKKLLETRIRCGKLNSEDEKSELLHEAQNTEMELSTGLIQLFTEEIYYSIRRLLPADSKVLFMGPSPYDIDLSNPFDGDKPTSSNEVKGGVDLLDYLTYNCLIDTESSCVITSSYDSICPYCDQEIHMTTLDRLSHMRSCLDKSLEKQAKPQRNVLSSGLHKKYFCRDCNTDLFLSLKGILKHRKLHE